MSAPIDAFYELIHGDGCPDGDLTIDIERLDSERRAEENTGKNTGKYRRPSVYVEAFEEMVNTVYKSEPHLLTAKELNVLAAFASLPYDARYCLVRLLLRKSNIWHTLRSMEKFEKEVGEDGLTRAISVLCCPIKFESEVKKEIKEEPELHQLRGVEIIDLTSDSDEEEIKPNTVVTNPGPSSLTANGRDIKLSKLSFSSLLRSRDSATYEPDFSFFLEDESSMELGEVLNKLSNDQLRELVKETKIRPEKMNKDAMVYSLLIYASTQQPLGFRFESKNERNMQSRDGLKQTLLCFREKKKVTRETQEKRLLQMALAKLGKSVRVNTDLHWLIARLNVIYERSTEYPKSLLVPSLLVSFKKRNYPEYTFTRDSMIWSTREEFMDYFEALRLEAAIQKELETPSPRRCVTKTPTLVTPTPSGRGQLLATTCRTPLSAARFAGSPAVCKREDSYDDEVFPECEDSLRVQTARRVKAVFHDYVFPQWKELVMRRRAQGPKVRAPGLERFEPGFVYTRVFSHAMQALAALKLYAEENNVVEALLQQPFWRQGKRARWYERRAILHTNYLCRDPDPEEKKKDLNVLRRAMEGIKEALNDEETHLVYRPSLVRRLMRLEKQLKIPEEDRSFCSGELRKAEEVQFFAERLKKSDKSLELDIHGRPIKGHHSGFRTYFSPKVTNAPPNGKTSAESENPQLAENFTARKWKGKSLWRGRNGEPVNVECRALQYYEDLGYKGFHSETRILTTLFALLFWDIIFADVPGAFETAHQTAPLDMAHDSFYRARKNLIDTRLEEIRQKGRAWEIVKRHDDLYRVKNTWCIGVRWDICTREDLLDIVECLGGDSLAIICRLFCEDYAGRSSGVPDLIVWNITARICKFVEVKGPGDTPSENQKLWFDSLIGAGANVEICKIFDKDKPPPKPSAKKARMQHNSKGKGKTPINPNVKVDPNSPDHLDQACISPPSSRKRRQSPDDKTDSLPTVNSSATPPASSSASALQSPNRVEVIIPPLKRRKLQRSP